MQIFGLISLMVVVAVAAWWLVGMNPTVDPSDTVVEPTASEQTLDPVIQAHIEAKSDLIRVDFPKPGSVVGQPLSITGEARGYWFFEASFPVVLTDWDGRIIAEHYATAEGEWMTEDFVPFSTEIEYESPYSPGDPDFMRRGTLILQRDNPSDLPENDDALEFPIYFAPPESASESGSRYGDALNSAEEAAGSLSN